MRTRRHAWLAVAAATSLILAACGGGDSSGGDGDGAAGGGEAAAAACPYDALEVTTEPVEITVWHPYTALGKRTLEALITEYNASQDKVVVQAEGQGSTQELHRKIEQAVPGRSLPALVVPDDTKTRYVADSGQFLAAQACFDADPDTKGAIDDLLPIAPASYTLDGKLWPASFSTFTALVYYNRAHFTAAGLDPDDAPTTLDEMIEDARAIKAAGVTENPFVFKPSPFLMEWWLSGVQQTLVNVDNGRGGGLATESTFDNDTTRAILKKLSDAEAEGVVKVTPSVEGNADHLLAMATQSASMLVDSSGAASTVAGVIEGTVQAEDIKAEFGVDLPPGLKLDLDIGVGPLPGVKEPGKGQVGGLVWYMTNTVPKEQQAAAWDFMKFINSPESQVTWGTDGSTAPVLKSLAENPELQAAWTGSLGGRWQKVAYDVLAGISTDFPGPVIGPYDQVRVAIGKCLDEVLLNDGDIDAAVKEADASITKVLADYQIDVGG